MGIFDNPVYAAIEHNRRKKTKGFDEALDETEEERDEREWDEWLLDEEQWQ